jgi:hypothetical protein
MAFAARRSNAWSLLMIAWRNRPLDSLSNTELQIAVEDAVNELALLRHQIQPNQFFSTFLGGFLAGGLLSALAFMLGAMLV